MMEALKSLKHLQFDGLLLTKKYNVLSAKELSFMTLNSDAEFEEKLLCGSKKDMRTVANFHQSTRKSQNWDSDGIL